MKKKKTPSNRDAVARFLVRLTDGLSDAESAALFRDLLMDYLFFEGGQLNADRTSVLSKIANDYLTTAPELGKDTGRDLLGVLENKNKRGKG